MSDVREAPGRPALPLSAPSHRSVFRAPRAAPVAGLIFAALFTAAVLMLRLGIPPTDAADLRDWTTDSATRILSIVGLYVLPFAGMAFLWLIAVIRDRVGEHEDRFYGTVFFGSGLLFLGLMLAAAAVAGSAVAGVSFLGIEAPGADVVSLLRTTAYTLMYVYAVKMAGAFMLVTAAIARRTHVFPAWISWFGILSALVLLLSVTFVEEVILLFPAWVTIVSVYSLVSRTSMGEALSLQKEEDEDR